MDLNALLFCTRMMKWRTNLSAICFYGCPWLTVILRLLAKGNSTFLSIFGNLNLCYDPSLYLTQRLLLLIETILCDWLIVSLLDPMTSWHTSLCLLVWLGLMCCQLLFPGIIPDWIHEIPCVHENPYLVRHLIDKRQQYLTDSVH